MTLGPTSTPGAAAVSIAVFAWNEEATIERALAALLSQSIFKELRARDLGCEVLCMVNGSTDRTAELAEAFFSGGRSGMGDGVPVRCKVVTLPQPGKLNAWNEFVHTSSAKEARCLFLSDADIILHSREALWRMFRALEEDAQAWVVVDRPIKDLESKIRKSVRDRVSLAASKATQARAAQLCAQLYCIRAEVARNIYMPRDLPACEDGFIKALVCTDFLTRPVAPSRIRLAEGAAHTFEAYTSAGAIVRNQKRQIMGQTVIHILVDRWLPSLPDSQRRALAQTLMRLEQADPSWLRRLIAEHIARVRWWWRLHPGLLGTGGFNPKAVPREGLLAMAAAGTRFLFRFGSSWMAWRAFKAGCTVYWPSPKRTARQPGAIGGRVRLELSENNP